MKKRIFALFLIAVLMLSLAACGGEPSNPSTSDSAGASSDSSVESSTNSSDSSDSSNSSDKQEVKSNTYNPEIDHRFIATGSDGIWVYDLDLLDGDFQKIANHEGLVWEWLAAEAPNSKFPLDVVGGCTAAKYRYSPVFERDVIVCCTVRGWAAVIDYETGYVLWEDGTLGKGPHTVEMLPNGDVIVGVSTMNANRLIYYSLSAGVDKKVHEIISDYPHGICWDPKNECLWISEMYGVSCLVIEGMGTPNAKMVRDEKRVAYWDGKANGGHAFAPVAGEPGKYWAATNQMLQIFDAETLTLTAAFPRSGVLSKNQIKGCCSFTDGTVIQVQPGPEVSAVTWTDDGFNIFTRQKTGGKVAVAKEVFERVVTVGYYKVHTFTKDYQ